MAGNNKPPLAKPRYTKAMAQKSIPGTMGIVSHVAKRMGCSVITIYNLLKKFPDLQVALDLEKGKICDLAENKIYGLINDGDKDMLKLFALNNKGMKERGWGKTVDMTVKEVPALVIGKSKKKKKKRVINENN